MCIVIDVNLFPQIFTKTHRQHADFAPLLKWINGSGRVVYGGTKYITEIRRMTQYWGMLLELKKTRKAEEVNIVMVDKEESRIKRATLGTDFNDAHIVAILIIAKRRLICSADKDADRYFLEQSLYPKSFPRTKIYRSVKHARLLNCKITYPLCRGCK